MAGDPHDGKAFVQLADVEVDMVRPVQTGFLLDGRGTDGAEYRLEMHLDLPVDRRTRPVLAKMLSQSEWRISRRVRPPPGRRARRLKTRSATT